MVLLARQTIVRFAAAAALLSPVALGAQAPSKKPLTQDTYDSWRQIQGSTLSPDGRWAAWTLTPVVGDGQVVVRATRGATEYRAARGFTGRPQLQPNADSGFTAPAPLFSADSRYLVYLTYAPQAEFDRARREKRKPADQPKAALAIMDLASGAVTPVPRVRSFRLAKDDGRWLAYLLEPDSAARPAGDSSAAAPAPVPAAAATPGGAPRPVSGDSARRNDRKKETGSTLVLRELATGREVRIADVTGYAMDDAGQWLGYTVSSRAGGRDGAWLRALASGVERQLLGGAGSYKSLVFDRKGAQVAFLSTHDDAAAAQPKWSLFHAALPAARVRVAVRSDALGDSALVAEKGRVEFVRDGSALVFGVAPPPLDSIPADSLADKAVLDLWHWKDTRLQPQQRLEAARDRDRSYTAIWFPKDGRVARLADDSLPQVTLSDDGRVALGVTELPYAVENMWTGGGADVVAVDARTGRRTRVAQHVEYGAQLSPGGRWIVWFAGGRWNAYETATGRTHDLTSAIGGVRFDQETWDTPSSPAPWGIAGWTAGDRTVLVYDRHDIWEIDPSGAHAPQMVTDSAGRRARIVLRYVSLDPDERYVDPAKPLLLRAFDEGTKASGFWTDRLGVRAAPERVVMADERFGTPKRARSADVYLVTRESFREFPDLWTGGRLDSLTRISDANPQQAEYRWGSAELVHWTSDDGLPLEGLLYKPEGFDPAKKYPIVAYFYEQLSDNLHQYHAPSGRNVINPAVYSSLGYLVFFPDIAYQTGYPGQSALKSIVPGVQMLLARGYVNPQAIGVAGQSWGGYQTAYMITQTRLFRAAFAGAPVANMTSAYGGIRWESGVARAFQYERQQSRIGGSIWQYPLRFLENSPLFYADRVETPVLIMSNDGDGAVPWYQGVELFVALRRNGKEVYLLNYNGDGHNPRKRANQKDVDMRMQQFFAHHLLGQAAPQWMEEGIPFLRKGRDQLATPIAGGMPGAKAPATAPAGGTGSAPERVP